MSNGAGSCVCKAINYRLNSEILNVVNCHCDFCRAHSGAVFATYAVLPESSIEIIQGEDILKSYVTQEGRKHFCGLCGTPIFNVNSRYQGVCMVYLGTLDGAENITSKMNIWCENKLEWLNTAPSIKSFMQGIER